MFNKYKSNTIRLFLHIKDFFLGEVIGVLKSLLLFTEFPIEVIGDILFFKKRNYKGKIMRPKKILIVRIDQFGDVLFSTFLLPIIKRRHPECEIDYLINKKTSEVLKKNIFIKNIFYWDEIFLRLIPGRKGAHKASIFSAVGENLKTMKSLKERSYDVVINERAFIPSSNIWWKMIGAKKLIAFDISEQSFLADYWAEYNLRDEEWENYMNLLLPLGIGKNDFFYKPIFENLDESIFERDDLRILKNVPYIVCAPVSFDKDREWSKENWRKVISTYRDSGGHIILTGIPSQKSYIEDILNGLDKTNIHIVTDVTLAQLGSLYRGAKLFIGIESFPTHLALALNKKILCLMNNEKYYLKNFSPEKNFSARSMVPILKGRTFLFDKNKTTPGEIVGSIMTRV